MPTKFRTGHVYATPGALVALAQVGHTPARYIFRHSRGDWGDLPESDKALNDQALVDGERVLSSYTLTTGEKLWVITEWDRSSTTLLLPHEY